jgi:hypothetical protein
MKFLIDGFKGSVLKNISKEYLTNLKIPIPKSQEKINEWVDKISLQYNEKNEKQLKIKELETFVQNRIKEIGENEECEIVELGSVCEIKYGKRITYGKNKGTLYDAYGGGDIMSYKTDEYNREGVIYKISRDGLSLHNCVSKIYGKIFLNDTALTLHKITHKISDEYIGEFLLNMREYLYKNCTRGSAQLHIDINRLKSIKIPIPKNKELITDLESVFAEIKKLQEDVRIAEELYKQLIQELSNEAIPPIAELTENNIKILNKDDKVDDTPSVKSNSSTKSTLSDLKKECKALGIKGYSKKNKEELTKMIQDFNTT